MGGQGVGLAATQPQLIFVGNGRSVWNANFACAFALRLLADKAMTQPTPPPSHSKGRDPIAEHRERIIALEAHGSPEDCDGLWDVMGAALAEMKRQQELAARP